MLKNEIPKWKVSEELIKTIIEEEFGVYVRAEKDDVIVFFLPNNIANRIPEVDVDLFIEWYDFYAKVLASEINLHGIFEGLKDFPLTPSRINQLQARIVSQIRVFNHVNKITAKEMMFQTFGIFGK